MGMKRSVMVIGMGRFGVSTVKTLIEMGHEVLCIDRDEARLNQVRDLATHAVQADTTDERALTRIGVRNFDCVVVCVGEDIRASILTTVLCREMGAKLIIAKAHDDLHAKLLYKTGADRVVQPEHDGGVRLARSLMSERIIDTLNLSDGVSISEIHVPRTWVGKTLVGLDARRTYGVSVIAAKRGGHMLLTVDPQAPLLAGDTLYVIGDDEALKKL